jgi:hypothetical protein
MWLAFLLFFFVVAVFAVASANGRRFGRRVTRESTRLGVRAAVAPAPIDRRRIETLPPPVRRYLTKALAGRETMVRAGHLRHGGTFRPSLDGAWLPVRGEHHFATDPPGFVWWGRVRLAPGLWIDGRDRCVDGVGHMLVSLESTLTLANRSGIDIDEGALHRVLGEMTWYPTQFLDDRYVAWTAVDDRRAQAALRVGGREVSGLFEFGDDDLPRTFTTERYRDTGGGAGVLTPFRGASSDYREAGGMLVPYQMVASWHVEGRAIPYARFELETVEYDAGPSLRFV